MTSSLQPPIASVIVVNFNGGGYLHECLESLERQSIGEQLEVILVDNASTDGSGIEAQARFDTLIYVQAETNLGFAGGNNRGFQEARGKYLLLLNNDAVAAPDWAEQLVNRAEREPAFGMITSRIVYDSDPAIIDNAGQKIYPDGLSRSTGHRQPFSGHYTKERETLFASGCAALYLRSAVESAGGFDEDFFAYCDDTDLGLKLRLLGLRCLYLPQAVVRHKSSMTAGKFSRQKLFWTERNRVWILLKYLPLSWIVVSPWFTARRLFHAWRAGQKQQGLAGEIYARHSAFSLILTLCHGWLAALLRLPQTLKKRHHLQAMNRLTGAEWKALLKQFRATARDMAYMD